MAPNFSWIYRSGNEILLTCESATNISQCHWKNSNGSICYFDRTNGIEEQSCPRDFMGANGSIDFNKQGSKSCNIVIRNSAFGNEEGSNWTCLVHGRNTHWADMKTAILTLKSNSTTPNSYADNKSSQTTYTAVIMALITIFSWIVIVLTLCYFSTRPLHKTFLFKSSARKNENRIEMIQITESSMH